MKTALLRPRWSSRLHARLIFAIGAALVLIDGARMTIGYRDDRAQAQSQVRAYLSEVTQHRAAVLAARLGDVMQATRASAWFLGSGHLAFDDPTLLDALTGTVQQTPLIYGSAVALPPNVDHRALYVHRKGEQLVRIAHAEQRVEYADQHWFSDAVAADKPIWSAPYFDRELGETRMVTYSVPWTYPRGGTAVLTADLQLDTLDIGWSSPWGGSTRIVDGSGRYLASSGDVSPQHDSVFDAAKALGVSALQQAGEEMQRGGSGIVRTHDPRFGGEAVWISWAPIGGTDWSLMALLYEDRVLANARAQLLHQFLLSLAALALVLGVLVAVTRRLTRPLDALRRVARAVRHGDHSQRTGVPARRDEVAQFAHAFDGMLDALQVSQDERLREAERRQHIEGELAAARELQRRLLPPDWPQWSRNAGPTPGFAFHGLCEPATLMSGDFYDAFRLDENTISLCVADVCGKGSAAALYMAMVYTRLRDFSASGRSPAQILAETNRMLCDEREDGMFVTLVLVHYRWRDGQLAFACAGHPPPLIVRHDGSIETLTERDGLVGAFADSHYHNAQAQLGLGDSLLLYSDGITEAGPDADRMYGAARLHDSARRAADLPLDVLCSTIVGEVLEHCGHTPGDDITLLAARRLAAS